MKYETLANVYWVTSEIRELILKVNVKNKPVSHPDIRFGFLDLKIQTLTLNIMLTLFSEVLVGEQAIGEVASPQVPLHLHR